MSSRSNSKSNYTRRINRVVNHLAAHPAQRFSIAELAALANFSDFHFHRLFKAYTGETPAELARRLRLERAAADLIYQRKPSITDLAYELGFSSSANFTKAFSAHFGVAPSHYAASRHRAPKSSQSSNQNSKTGKASSIPFEDTSDHALVRRSKPPPATGQLQNPGADVVIEDQSLVQLAYVRHVGPYQPEIIEGLFAKLAAWAQAQGPFTTQGTTQGTTLGITWSDSSVAEPQTWRYDAAMVVNAQVQVGDGIDLQPLAAGKIAVLELSLNPPDYSPIAVAWDYLLGEWLPNSTWQPAHRPSFERYNQGASGKQMQLCLPIEPNVLGRSP